ncbi:serine O-acetyltransferase [Methylophaga sp.]|uniref:serine O-acetyltransferase n=1 Tax=Methylophaga sp. TaxID=2024840 RepID=UPI002724B0FA|nr:serine O-acetyltransferase [Methylophaga sp.]MDO8828068.1 serine O-acetyltransferase [Methylophaga sp.]
MNASPSRQSLWSQWSEDIKCVFDRDPAARNTFEILLTYPGVHALLVNRLTHRLWQAEFFGLARFLAFLCRTISNVDIHPGATIGHRLFIDHGAGVVIGETAVIGDDVTLYHGVTLGGTTWNKEKRHPTLGNSVLVGAGAKILGNITLGDSVRVGANSVVVKDVPACCTVIGIPGRIIQRKGLKIKLDNGIDLDHHLVPDPVGKAISCLIERIDKLEAAQKNFAVKPDESCERCEADDVCKSQSEPAILEKAVG